MISKFIFLISESFKALFRNKIHAIISSLTIAISIIFINIVLFSYQGFKSISYKFKSNYVIDVFFEDNISHEAAIKLYDSINFIEGLQKKEFIDKQKAASIFKKYFNEDVENILGENPLPFGAKFRIQDNYRDFNSIELMINKIKIIEGVNDVNYENNLIKKIDEISENAIIFIVLIGLFFIFISIVLISNTIRLIIDSKKETIRIFELLGATKLFIKIPFLLEGILQGFIGAIISIFIIYSFESILIYIFKDLVEMKIFDSFIVLSNISIGLIMGFIGSSRIISKYL